MPVPVPYREGDGGTVHKRPQGTVWGRLGTVDADRAMAAFRDPPRGLPRRGSRSAPTRSRRGTRSGWIFEAFLLLPKSRVCSPCCIGPDGQGLQHRGDGANVNAGNYCNRVGSSAEGTLLSVPMRIACRVGGATKGDRGFRSIGRGGTALGGGDGAHSE